MKTNTRPQRNRKENWWSTYANCVLPWCNIIYSTGWVAIILLKAVTKSLITVGAVKTLQLYSSKGMCISVSFSLPEARKGAVSQTFQVLHTTIISCALPWTLIGDTRVSQFLCTTCALSFSAKNKLHYVQFSFCHRHVITCSAISFKFYYWRVTLSHVTRKVAQNIRSSLHTSGRLQVRDQICDVHAHAPGGVYIAEVFLHLLQ